MYTRRILIVGGGSSGWMTAAYLNGALNFQGNQKNVEIKLIESPDIPRISVGEATIPSIRHILSVIGVNEIDFMKATDASFKQSIKYVNWVNNNNTFYHHPFSRFRTQPIDRSGMNWLRSSRNIPFMETCSAQPIICEMGLSAQMLGQWELGPPLSYAYHFNAQLFADYLRDFSVARGVEHILANVTDIDMDESGDIKSVATDTGNHLEADLFIDCTGFKAKLIEEKMDVTFEDCSQWLLCDRAVTMHVPYDNFYPGMIRPYTTATALSNGWIWDIPMRSRRSVGYVHSSQFISEQDAEAEMRAYQGAGCEDLPARFVHFKVGRRQQNWKGNCIAIGLSGGFIEPLESTGLYLADLGAVMLAEHFPYRREHMKEMAFRYNRILSNRFYEILDFINMHYCMTRRTDTEFWREVQKPERITERLKAKLEYWKMKPPSATDFEDQCFPGMQQVGISTGGQCFDGRAAVDTAGLWNHESYECILYGMGFLDKEFDELFGTNRPPSQVHPHVLHRLQAAKQKIPPHAVWLKQKLGMEDYTIAQKPAGWVC
ncbi:tryptophan halogenase family protein [Aliikangiella coralliicola]|uniref:Tryptophan 7-halogenase n=1 Tax=Aliikangiella coralliicola TaxID=2592383 RepID=A0A545UK09_9GAMM|nr:tryptophan halogenase family protein [Aliikangiella coralliicola]TQV89798.1 tryptophan 7-halogenase [Aliikangiella coralliicola]